MLITSSNTAVRISSIILYFLGAGIWQVLLQSHLSFVDREKSDWNDEIEVWDMPSQEAYILDSSQFICDSLFHVPQDFLSLQLKIR